MHFLERLEDRLSPRTVVSLYWPMRDEMDVLPLITALADRDVPTALPVMQGADAPLLFRCWRYGDSLQRGSFGVDEPTDGEIVRPDIVVAPLLAFDAAGNRLGYGGGYYDRTLAGLRSGRSGRSGATRSKAKGADVLAVGVAYDAQQIETMPVHPGDQVLDMIVTERRVLEFENGAA